jgi:hypothetical protein
VVNVGAFEVALPRALIVAVAAFRSNEGCAASCAAEPISGASDPPCSRTARETARESTVLILERGLCSNYLLM